MKKILAAICCTLGYVQLRKRTRNRNGLKLSGTATNQCWDVSNNVVRDRSGTNANGPSGTRCSTVGSTTSPGNKRQRFRTPSGNAKLLGEIARNRFALNLALVRSSVLIVQGSQAHLRGRIPASHCGQYSRSASRGPCLVITASKAGAERNYLGDCSTTP